MKMMLGRRSDEGCCESTLSDSPGGKHSRKTSDEITSFHGWPLDRLPRDWLLSLQESSGQSRCQKMSLRPNWIWRAVLTVLETWPNLRFVNLNCGMPKLG